MVQRSAELRNDQEYGTGKPELTQSAIDQTAILQTLPAAIAILLREKLNRDRSEVQVVETSATPIPDLPKT